MKWLAKIGGISEMVDKLDTWFHVVQEKIDSIFDQLSDLRKEVNEIHEKLCRDEHEIPENSDYIDPARGGYQPKSDTLGSEPPKSE